MGRHVLSGIGSFAIDTVPNQPQVAHCHSFFVDANKRGKGNGHALKKAQNVTLKALMFDYATCTVDASNEAQIKVLIKAGWNFLAEFNNRKTGGKTQIWGWEIE